MSQITTKNLNSFVKSNSLAISNLSFLEKQLVSDIATALQEDKAESLNDSEFVIKILSTFDFLSLIFLGIISGYFPSDLNEELRIRIIRFLEIEPIREYYGIRKRSFLMESLVAYCYAIENNNHQIFLTLKNISKKKAWVNFNKFFILQKSISNDPEIKEFFLFIENYDTLESKAKLAKSFDTLNSCELLNEAINLESRDDKITVGAIKFASKLVELDTIINNNEINKLFQSGLWHFYGFYYGTCKSAYIHYYTILFNALTNTFAESDFKNDVFEKMDHQYSFVVEKILINTQTIVLGFPSKNKIKLIMKKAIDYQEETEGVFA